MYLNYHTYNVKKSAKPFLNIVDCTGVLWPWLSLIKRQLTSTEPTGTASSIADQSGRVYQSVSSNGVTSCFSSGVAIDNSCCVYPILKCLRELVSVFKEVYVRFDNMLKP